ncbi:beta strand repeat-containing protein [Deinococcus aquiradiocola]|uniref:DUF11 domain-containing protein n=1 Tax=Deinococcus aquiradiocola TaxID=393059 RepID=A0A917PFR9_9DEIO|nr:DUF11 domain-containing protein [Deinococcus aquiradiocola]GGJ74511.1 hypothetical protein GCM10008939_18540 [Deinococcus aquiradiocola]
MTTHPRTAVRTLLLTLGLCAAGAALGVGTPANTNIQNTATLNYQDSLGGTRNKDSNTVTVRVRQVYALSVETSAAEGSVPPTRAFQSIAGNRRLISYTIQNAGNGSDTVDLSVVQSATDDYDAQTAIYLDANNDGVPDGAAISSVTLAAVQDGSTGDRTTVLLEVTAPVGTPDGQVSRFALKGVSRGDTSKLDDQNYASLTVSPTGQIALSETVSPAGGINPGGTLTYTVTGTVTGAAVGAVTGVVTVDGTARNGVLVRVPLPGVTFGGVSASSTTSGTTLPIYSTDNGGSWTATLPASGTVTDIALLVVGSGTFLPSGGSVSLTYTAVVPAGTAAGTVISSTATSVADGNGDTDGSDSGETVTATAVTSTVNALVSAVAGPFAFPAGGASGSYTFGGHTIDRSADTQAVSGAVTAGTNVSFKHTIQNTGNATENLTAVLSGVPAGWTCTLQNVSVTDTLTPFSNPVTLAAGATLDIAVVCSVPVTSGAATNTDLTLTVTPQGGTADTTVDRVAQVVPAGAAVLGNGDRNPATAPDTSPATQAANPGQNASFPLEVLNGGPVAETYTLTSSVPGAVFYADTNCDGTPDGAAITVSPSVPAGGTVCLIAVVPVAAGTAAGTSPITFTATSTAEASRTSTVTDSLRSNAVLTGSLTPDGALSTIAGGSVTYAHTLGNSGNAPVTANFAAYTSPAGLTYTYSTDNVTFTPTLSVNVAAGGTQAVYVRVTVPVSVTGSVSEATTVTAALSTALAPNPTLNVSATDTTTVQSVTSSVVKSAELCSDTVCTTSTPLADNDPVSPGDIVRYRVVATNTGTSTLYGSYLVDSVPADTELVSVGAAGSVLYSVDDGASWNVAAPTSLPLGRFWVGVNSDGNGSVNSLDALAPGGTFTLVLTVKVK